MVSSSTLRAPWALALLEGVLEDQLIVLLPVPHDRAYSTLGRPREILQHVWPGIDSLHQVGQYEYEMH